MSGVMRVEVIEIIKEGIDIVSKLLNKIAKTANPETRQGIGKMVDLSGSAVRCLGLIKDVVQFTDIYSTVELKEEERKKISEIRESLEKTLGLYPKSNKGNFSARRSRLSNVYDSVIEFRENFYKFSKTEIEEKIERIISSIYGFSDEESYEFRVKEDERELYKAVRKNKRYF